MSSKENVLLTLNLNIGIILLKLIRREELPMKILSIGTEIPNLL